jgi:hypothetical protein
MFNTTTPGNAPQTVLLCCLFTLRFESTYLLPWLAHHAVLGVDHFDLYLDDASHSWDESQRVKHAPLLRLLEDSKHITLHSMRGLG